MTTTATPGRVRIGEREYTVERPSARKASRAFKLLKRVSGTVKDVTKALGQFDREYAEANVVELDRVQARMHYPPRPLLGEDGHPIREPDTIPKTGPAPEFDGETLREVEMVPNPRAGELIMAPSPLDALTEADWERAGHRLRRPMAPTAAERAGAVFELAIDQAEDSLYRVLALFTLSNDEVARHVKAQSFDQELDARADVILDEGGLDEVLELAVVIGETIDDQLRRKIAEDLGERAGNALRLFGIDLGRQTPQTGQETPQTGQEEETPTSSTTPTLSTASPDSTDGHPTPPSTPTTPSSSPSANAKTTTAA